MIGWLIQNAVLAAVLAAAVALVVRLARPGPAARHALWLVVLLRLVLPPGPAWPWHLPVRSEVPQTVAAPLPTESPTEDVMFAWVERDPDHAAADPAPAVELVTAAPAEPWWREPARLAAVAWLLGGATVMGRAVRETVRLRRLVRAGSNAPGAVVHRVTELARSLGVRPPRVVAAPGLGSPLIAGLPRPVLLWPSGLEQRLSVDGVKAVLAHELAHLRRRDHWVRWLEVLAGCVWWWNPLFALVRRQVRRNAELACDAWVLAVLPAARRAYAEALLAVCERASSATEPAPAVGVGGDRRDFQRRLTMIMKDRVACRVPRAGLLAVGVLAAVAVPGWTFARPDPPRDPMGSDPPARTAGQTPPAIELDEVFDLRVNELADLVTAGAEDRDARLRELEMRIQELLLEIQKLKAASRATADQEQKEARLRDLAARSALARVKPLEFRAGERRTTELVTVRRAAYALPPDTAKALAEFLTRNLAAEVLEAKAQGGTVTVTTTPPAQDAVAKLVALIGGRPTTK